MPSSSAPPDVPSLPAALPAIRRLTDADLKMADAILQAAFGGPAGRLSDLQLYRRLQPDGWFLAEHQAQPVGVVGGTVYPAYAYVGFMGIHPAAQRHGIGRALMEHVLAWLDGQRVPLVRLDASPAGQPLYEKLGFVPYDETLVFYAPRGGAVGPCPPRVQRLSATDLETLIGEDTLVFGTDRGRVLRALWQAAPERAFWLRDAAGRVQGYVFAQPARIGPWVMCQAEGAEALLQAALSVPYADGASLAVPAKSVAAQTLLRRYGFERTRANRHMARGAGPLPGQREKVYGQTSLAVG